MSSADSRPGVCGATAVIGNGLRVGGLADCRMADHGSVDPSICQSVDQ
jgi:hypothetical protein